MPIPKFKDVLVAQRQIRPYLPRTPLHGYPAINNLVGTEVYIKHENYQPIGAFKVRGGINLISQLSPGERARGVITASTGNHGQSLAFAARLFGVKARIVVPERANPGKVAAMQGMGAEVIFHGPNFDEARRHCEALADEQGYRYVHSGDEPLLIAGVATEVLEMLEDQPDLQVILVPVGGGSGAAGACLVARRSIRPFESSGFSPKHPRQLTNPGGRKNWWKRPTALLPKAWPLDRLLLYRRRSSGKRWMTSSCCLTKRF